VAQRLLSLLPADLAHEIGQLAFSVDWLWSWIGPQLRLESEMTRTHLCGLELDSPIGLAAGYDKDGDLLKNLMKLDFSFITVGSVTLHPRAGNPRPRLSRFSREQGLGNAMGLPSKGLSYVLGRLSRVRRVKPIIGSIAGFTPTEYHTLYTRLRPLVDLVEINVSSPTFPQAGFDAEMQRLVDILETLRPEDRAKALIKIPPYERVEEVQELLAICRRYGVGGVTATNTKRISDPRLSRGMGGLSGRPLLRSTRRIVRLIRQMDERIQLVACGGVFTGRDVMELIGLGANAVSILTSFIYRGPAAPRSIKQELISELRRWGFSSVEEARGHLLRR
jgi:dihydroorotate dehydrogenase